MSLKPIILGAALLPLILAACSTVERVNQLRTFKNPTANSSAADSTVTRVSATRDQHGRRAALLSAFYGLDDGLPRVANKGIGKGAGGADGMPAIFSHEIDASSLQAGDFRITTASGKIGEIKWVTLAPADDPGESRTVLFAGHFGSIHDQPVKLEMIGNLLSLDGSLNFKGASVAVTPLEAGPTMVWAELVPASEWDLGKKATPLRWGGGSGAPQGARQVVRVTWAGGVTKPGGREVDDAERRLYSVTVRQKDGSIIKAIPFALADLGDGDNNHELCLDVDGTPLSVDFPAGHLTDPREDLNPESSIRIRH